MEKNISTLETHVREGRLSENDARQIAQLLGIKFDLRTRKQKMIDFIRGRAV